MIVAAVLSVACHKDKYPDSEDAPYPMSERVVVVYIMGENSLSSYVKSDLNEMRLGASKIPDNCRLVIYYDDSESNEKPRILSLSRQGGEEVLHQYDTDPVSTDSATMQNVLAYITTKCPAQHYGLVLWSHGSGWTPPRARTIGIDNGSNTLSNLGTEMEISTLAHVMENTGRHWDYVFFDACFMQGVEVAYQLRRVTDWCIGSPAEIPGRGAPYDQIMSDLFATTDDCWRIAETYHNAYEMENGVVLSTVRTSELEALAAATAPHIREMETYPTSGIQTYCAYSATTIWKPEYFDIGSAMALWLDNNDYAAWLEVFRRAVPHYYLPHSWLTAYSSVIVPIISDSEHAVGLSFYIPIEGRNQLNQAFPKTDWYRDSGWRE